jgi:hypothetical protein
MRQRKREERERKEERERERERPSAVWDRSSTLNTAHPNPTKSTKINATKLKISHLYIVL